MDLEVIFRALWRRRLQLLLSMIAFAIIVPVIFIVRVPAKYESSTQVQVYPAPDINQAELSYPTDPDRYVATAVAAIASREAAAEVAKKLKLETQTVAEMTAVAQIEKSDAIGVTATDHDPNVAYAVAKGLADNYVNRTIRQNTDAYNRTLEKVTKNIETVTATIAARTAALPANVSNDPVLTNLQQRQADLTTKQQNLQDDLTNVADNSKVISVAAVSKQPTGTGKKTLAVYGAALGLGLAALVVTLGTTPGRSLEELDSLDEIQGVEVLGVLEPKRGGGGRNDVTDVHGLRIGSELRTIIKHKGQLTVVPIGRRDRMNKACSVLVRLVEGQTARDDDEAGLARTDSFAAFLELPEPENQRVVLVVDVDKISRRDLVDTLVTLGALGTEVMGLVGVR